VPVGEAEQIVNTLRTLGRPVEYLRFEDEGHGLVKLANRITGYTAIGEFLDRWLQQR
jgi:dipeptidyl aminopeptidase/acylaminoacyl peptidase